MKHFFPSYLMRAAIVLLLTSMTTKAAYGQDIPFDKPEGPWTYYDYHIGTYNYSKNGSSINYIELAENSHPTHWGGVRQEHRDNWQGIGIAMSGDVWKENLQGLFSLYKCEKTVPSYTTYTLHWKYYIICSSTKNCTAVNLYAMDDKQKLMALPVIFAEFNEANAAGKDYRLLNRNACGNNGWGENDITKGETDFIFDNSDGINDKNLQKWLMMTLAVGNGDGKDNSQTFVGRFKSLSDVWTPTYYAHITYDVNGGRGSIDKQKIGGKGNLTMSYFEYTSRDSGIRRYERIFLPGFIFDGWNTKADGSGISYLDGAKLEVTESTKGPITLYAQWRPIPQIVNCEFRQKERKVVVKWEITSTHKYGGYFAVYRGNIYLGSVPCTDNTNQFEFEDTNTPQKLNFPYEEEKLQYSVYYVAPGKNVEKTKEDALCSTGYANTTRKLPINNCTVEGKDTAVVITWTSDQYESNWGSSFTVVIRKEGKAIDSLQITPANNQGSFRWEHRSIDKTTQSYRTKGHTADGSVWYVTEPLSACDALDYVINGYIDGKRFSSDTLSHCSTQSGSQFTSIQASQGAYEGMVKLSWRINPWGSYLAKTYTIKRRHVDSSEEWITLEKMKTDNDYITYTDDTALPGSYYEYQVEVREQCNAEQKEFSTYATTIGFAKATGLVSGRVAYGTSGIAVAGVDVVANAVQNGDNAKQYYSIYFDSPNGQAEWIYSSDYNPAQVFNKEFSIQLWVYPNTTNKTQTFLRTGKWSVGTNDNGVLILVNGNQTYKFSKIQLQKKQYYHLTLTHNNKTVICYVIHHDDDGLPVVTSDIVVLPNSLDMTGAKAFTIGGFTGYMDEFRLWTKVLTQNEIVHNYDRLLVGNEVDLETYWNFDAGLSTHFFDISRSESVYHAHHGMHGNNVTVSPYVPNWLTLKATTDVNGNYTIAGIPFVGEGTTYSIIPTLGIHSFNPTQQQRYISANSLVHNDINFEDVSSFPVSGTVYYAGTNYPVEGCNFYVDGMVCSKDGELIQSDAYGRYAIDVPIGEHFIQVKKQGHEFVNDGRYPDKAGTYIYFDQEIKNLTFYDSTLVNFTGRVVGGDIEDSKPVGFGQSKNNIGMATLTLAPRGIENTNYYINAVMPTDGTVIRYEPNPDIDSVSSASPDTIRSKAWRGYGSADECQKFYIRTDSVTGEFSALLPPLDYFISSIHVNSANLEMIDYPVALDMTNPLMVYKDSVLGTDSIMQYYEYHALMRQVYHSQPTFNVTQREHTDGSFGIDEYEIKDEFGVLKLNDIHHVDSLTGKLEYTYGYPLFVKDESYIFDIEGYEEYMNKDGKDTITDRVPLSDIGVTIDNALSDGKVIYTADNTVGAEFGSAAEVQSHQLTLDSLGKATYTWFAGFPNLTGAHTCDLNISYEVDGHFYQWLPQAMKGIVLGEIPTGTNFVTAGPKVLLMVLRDPPGSQSYATWEKGTATRSIKIRNSEDGYFDNKEIIKFGGGTKVESGVGVGLMVISSAKWVVEGTAGIHLNVQQKTGTVSEISATATQAISTSNSPEYDGAEGDVFFGMGTNLLFGKCIDVNLYRDPNDTTKAIIDKQEATLTNMSFETTFAYTQHYIEHDLIPNLKMLRNNHLIYVPIKADAVNYVNNTGKPVYLTWLQPTDPNYGESESDYIWIYPEDDNIYVDSVAYFNEQIRQWKEQLAKNEQEKVEANRQRAELETNGTMTNYSFDAGSSITNTFENDKLDGTTHENSWFYHGIIGVKGGFLINESTGLVLETTTEFGAKDKQNASWEETTEDDTSVNVMFGYTLKDTDPTDAISVDVYKNYGYFGSPLFRTRGGQTSNKYEGEVKTKYFEPGTTIMEATMQVEKPQIEAEPRTVSNVPSGSAANFALKLRNLSEINADVTYKLSLLESSNPHGAQLIIDGAPLTGNGRQIHIPYGEITKSMQLLQSNMSQLDYQNIGIVLSSQHQSSIADTVYVTAHFVPSSSPVTLAVNTNIINTHTDTVLVLTMKDFDRNFYNLKAFRMQYKMQGGKWTNLREYVLDGEHLSSGQQLLPDSMHIVYRLSMKNAMSWPDATYSFRIASVSTYGTDEIYVYSNEETVIKDTSYPRPLGQAQPADGILEIGDELSITYNIPFLSGALSPENFLVTGVLNGAPVEHYTALRANEGIEKPAAQTEANINLSGKDFSLDAWLYIQSDGVLLSHGADKQRMTIATNEQKQLVISLGDSVYTSQATMPRDKWVFFTLSRKVIAGAGKMSVSIAYDDVIQPLFDTLSVPLYYGNGPIAAGGGAMVAIHELLLWDEARDVATALQQRAVTKSPSTQHLIGYWKMDEGEGTFIRDYARNRHMAMPNESWYLNNINHAVTLNGNQYFAACTANVPPLPQDDYAMEMWLQGGEQADTAQLMQLGDISLWLDTVGILHLQSGDNHQLINRKEAILNNAWHHILLNVRRYGTAAIYIDGERALTISADKIGNFASDSLLIGARRILIPKIDSIESHYLYDRYFKGSIDEVRLWKTTIASDMLASKRKLRLNGDEPGLSLYYPFEKKQLDEFSQIVTRETLEELTGHGTEAVISDSLSVISHQFTDDAPALMEKPTQTNVAFSYTASDTKIVIDIDEDPAIVDGCTLYLTVKDVRSVNGNPSLPATWSAFVHRNELSWKEEELTVVKEVDETTTFSATLINLSGKSQRWTLSELPASLSASSTSGMLDPLEKTTITFSINPTAPLGKHERTIYAMGNNGVPTPLTLHVKVTGEVPDWSVDPTKYESSMNVISQLDFFGHISDDEDDIVAAFIDDECRGVTKSEYKNRYDGYYQTLTIYGDSTDKKKTVTFRAYRASTGVYYMRVTPSKKITYKPLDITGRYDEPILLSVNDQIVQRTTLKQGWNWISFLTKSTDMRAETVFAEIADDVEAIKGRTNSIGSLLRTDTGWVGSMKTLTPKRSYMVKMKNERELVLVGKSIIPANYPVSIYKGWGWPGYYGLHHITLANALAGADPQNGDIARTQYAAAYYDDYEWVGSLQTLEPGQGYAYYSVAKETKSFAYPSSSVSAAPRRAFRNLLAGREEDDDDDETPTYTGRFAPEDEYAYPYNMILVGQVLYDKEPAPNAEIAFFDGDECRSVGYTDENGRVMMMIAGEEETTLQCKLVLEDKIYETIETLRYVTDAIVGMPDNPHIIHFGIGQGIENVQSDTIQCTKELRDGILYIIRNGHTYDTQGKMVK